MPWMAALSALVVALLWSCPGTGMTKESVVLLEKALKQSEQELSSLQQAYTKKRKGEVSTAQADPEKTIVKKKPIKTVVR